MKISAQNRYQQTLYDSRFEHDNCGIGFVARINGQASHDILTMALVALGNQAHRGAVAADAKTGDGAGILTQIPRDLFLRELEQQNIRIDAADLAVGVFFFPTDTAAAETSCRVINEILTRHGLNVLRWRDVPTNQEVLGHHALETMPRIRQVFLQRNAGLDEQNYEQLLFLARKELEQSLQAQGLDVYIPSLSCRTIVYKGLMLGTYLADFYPDLADPMYHTALAVYHQRYSTNTFPTWERAQPFRMVSHNGEINTLQGNINWSRARQAKLHFPEVQGAIGTFSRIVTSIVDTRGSDSSMFDNMLEVLVLGGRDIRHAIAMMAPEAWEKIPNIDPAVRDFYKYHACLMEPWDGPAALTFSDGHIVGTTLDRNGLRPARYCITDDGLVISGSEAGVVPIEDKRIIHKGRLGPGQMIAVDTRKGTFYTNQEMKQMLAARQPYGEWLHQHFTSLATLMPPHQETLLKDTSIPYTPALPHSSNGHTDEQAVSHLSVLQMAFGYTSEELQVIIKPMAREGHEPVGSMGDDTPIAVLSQLELGRPLFHYFKQRFAEVTNPPIDPLREELVMSLSIALGKRLDVLEETPEHAHLLHLPSPFITDTELAAIRTNKDPLFRTATVSALMPVSQRDSDLMSDEERLHKAVEKLCKDAEEAVQDGATLLIISDRGVDAHHAPIPSLLAVGAVHHHLIRAGVRGYVSLIVESGEPREVHHAACLVGYGAKAINPYLALASARAIAEEYGALPPHKAERNFIKALEKGVLKIMSKMGISPVESYCNAQIFEVVGLDRALIDQCFPGTPSRVGGIGFEKLSRDVQTRHNAAFGAEDADGTGDGDVVEESDNLDPLLLPHTGFYKFKRNGESHAYGPMVVRAVHEAIQLNESNKQGAVSDGLSPDGHVSQDGYQRYRAYSNIINTTPLTDLRDLLEFVAADTPVPLEEVEPVEAIVRRFSTAAISHGALSNEAHETLAIAMNRLGGLSNSGEGGEAVERYGTERNSNIKQVASGRFGVTPTYLVNARELQIKMAQGSKPGEGGQLPGHKVSEEIARIRHTTPGVALISPPPHHDIYSIEDLAQLIYDLKQINPDAFVSVKLVSTSGVGTIAAGVAKGYADVILISGYNGGTGASPLSSIKNAGMPWELGLSETQQTLVMNGLRGRVRLRTDGGLQNGRDVVIAAMLGADEFSFGTLSMVIEGCRMARVCHSNTCPVGVATQRPELRAKFAGKPEMVMAFFRYLAQEVRETLASLGLRSMNEAIGRVDLLRQRQINTPGARDLDLSAILAVPEGGLAGREIRHSGENNILPGKETLNERIVRDAQDALERRIPVTLTYPIQNCDRTVGATLAGAISERYSTNGLPAGTMTINLQGSAGQSFGAFTTTGMRLSLIGEANDYVGKGMGGGQIAIRPGDHPSSFIWHENVVAGNTILYGATGGELYLAGTAGERFGVRNSGATAVVEGLGDHGCEYMTGGVVVVLGPTGYNFGAGMTGGVAYVLDEEDALPIRYNRELVQLDRLDARGEEQVRTLVQQHHEQTGSPRAVDVLEHWSHYRGKFWRVMPREMVAKIEASNEGAEEENIPTPIHVPGSRTATVPA